MEIVNIVFRCCCEVMFLLGKLIGLTYKEVCVVFNLYVQGVVLMLSGCLPLVAAIRRSHTQATLIAGIYAALYVAGFAWIVWRYGGPMVPAFDRCVDDLLYVAQKWHTTYNMVNIIIFVLLWIALFFANIFIALRIQRS